MPEHVHQLCCFDVALVDKRKLGDPKLLRQRCLQGVKVRDHHSSEVEASELLWSASEPAFGEWLK